MARFLLENARWLAAGLILTLCSSFGQTYFISLFAGEIKAAHGLSDGGWGGIYTLATLISAAALIQGGGLADTVRLGRLALGVIALYAAVAVGMALNHGSAVVLVALIAGLRFCGQGMMSHIAITAMGRWFRAQRGRAVAVAGLGHALGEAVLPALTVLAIAWIGWRASWGVAAMLLVLGFAPLLAWLLAEHRQPRGTADTDLSAGLGGRHWQRREVLGHWLFWALMPGVLAPSFIGTAAFFHQVHVSGVKDWPLAVMALGYPAYAATTVGSSLACGWLADRFGPRTLLPVYLLPLGAGIAVLAAGQSVTAWYGMLVLMGLTQGGAQTLLGALWPELYGTRSLGAIKALATAAMVFSTAIGPGVTGALIDLGLDFPAQGWGLALWCLVASAALLLVRARLAAEFPPPPSPRPQPARARTGGK